MVEQRHKVETSPAPGAPPVNVNLVAPLPMPVEGTAGAGLPVEVAGVMGAFPVAVGGLVQVQNEAPFGVPLPLLVQEVAPLSPQPVVGTGGGGLPLEVANPAPGGVPTPLLVQDVGGGGGGQLPATQAETVKAQTLPVDNTAPVAFSDVVMDFANGPLSDPMVLLVHCEKIPGMGAGTEDVTVSLEIEFPSMGIVAAATYYYIADYIDTLAFSQVLNDAQIAGDTVMGATTQPYLFNVNFLKKIKNISVASTSGTAHNVTLVWMSPRGLV